METVTLDDVRLRLNRNGRRMTPQRAEILKALRATRSHPTAEELHATVQEALPRISLGTVYRNLQVLVSEGWALRLPTTGGSHRFDGTVEEHHHAECIRCSRIFDVSLPEGPKLGARVAKETGLTVTAWHARFEGICRNCAKE